VSALTKTFVVLLVVCSLLLTAATVVFVNRTEDYRTKATAAAGAQAQAEQKYQQAVADATAAKAASDSATAEANRRVADKDREVVAAQQDVSKRDLEIVDLKNQLARQSLDSNRMAEALKASQDMAGSLQAQIADIRKREDQAIAQNADLNKRVSDLQATLDVTERDRKNATEQLAAVQQKLQDLQGRVTKADPSLLNPSGGATAATPAPGPINGVVREVKNIGNVPYATISVGAAADVKAGMEFNVIDRDRGQWLGKLIVDRVEPNESTGRLEGPNVKNVHPGVEVKTQL
jgi:hypothetical protein